MSAANVNSKLEDDKQKKSETAAQNTATTINSQNVSEPTSPNLVVCPPDWQMTGGAQLKKPGSVYETFYERRSLEKSNAYDNNLTDKKASLDMSSNANNKQDGKFHIKGIAFLRLSDETANAKPVQTTNRMTIWYNYGTHTQNKLDLGLGIIEHPWIRFFKRHYCYSVDETYNGGGTTIDVESMREHFLEEFFTYLQKETDLSAEASTYFRKQAGHKPAPASETKNLKDMEEALNGKNYEEALRIAGKIHADSIEENRKLGKVLAFYDRHGNLKNYYFDEARAAYDLHLRLLHISPEHAYKALEILQEGSPYFKEAQLKMANILLGNAGGDEAYRKKQLNTLDIAGAREHLLLSDCMSDLKAMELAVQHHRYDDAVEIAGRIHILSAEKNRRKQTVFGNDEESLDKTSAAYDLYSRLLPLSPVHAYRALEILKKDSSYFIEAQEKMANILLLVCATSKEKKEIKEKTELALIHLRQADMTSPSVIYLQLLANELLTSALTPDAPYNRPDIGLKPPITPSYELHTAAANPAATATSTTTSTAKPEIDSTAKAGDIPKAK